MRGLRAVCAAAGILGLVLVVLLAGARAATSEGAAPDVLRLVVDGGITDATRDYVAGGLEQADRQDAEVVVLQLDTPGGLLTSTRAIVRSILESPVPVVAFVAPEGARAGSAGLFLTLAAHVAAMAPSTNIGAAHPVSLFGGADGTMSEKVANDAAAWARSLAETRGRDAAFAEKAVKDSASFTVKEALDRHLVDLEAPDLPALLDALDGRRVTAGGAEHVLRTRGAAIEDFEKSGAQIFYGWLADPALLYALLLAGLLGIFIELQHPGLIVPGALGACCLGVVFGLQVLPINTFGALLITFSAVLFVAEVYVTSFGLLAFAGLSCLVAGSYLLFDVPGSTYRLEPSVIWSVAVVFAAVLLSIGWLLVRAKRQGATTGAAALVGQTARVCQGIPPSGTGKVFFDGAYWNATAAVAIEVGRRVRIDSFEGLLVHVSPVGEKGASR